MVRDFVGYCGFAKFQFLDGRGFLRLEKRFVECLVTKRCLCSLSSKFRFCASAGTLERLQSFGLVWFDVCGKMPKEQSLPSYVWVVRSFCRGIA